MLSKPVLFVYASPPDAVTAAVTLTLAEIVALRSIVRDFEIQLPAMTFTEATKDYKRRQLVDCKTALDSIHAVFASPLGIRS